MTILKTIFSILFILGALIWIFSDPLTFIAFVLFLNLLK